MEIDCAYDDSFFRKNNIIGRFPFSKSSVKPIVNIIDVIVVKKHIDLKSVVNNFDLTFCEIWYDGTTIHANNLSGAINKVGKLKEDYLIKLLNQKNMFTCARMIKYHDKDYIIENIDINYCKKLADEKNVTLSNFKSNSEIIYKLSEGNNVAGKKYEIEEFTILLLIKTIIKEYNEGIHTGTYDNLCEKIFGKNPNITMMKLTIFVEFFLHIFNDEVSNITFYSFNEFLSQINEKNACKYYKAILSLNKNLMYMPSYLTQNMIDVINDNIKDESGKLLFDGINIYVKDPSVASDDYSWFAHHNQKKMIFNFNLKILN